MKNRKANPRQLNKRIWQDDFVELKPWENLHNNEFNFV